MAEDLIAVLMDSNDARWLQGIIINDSELDDKEHFRLISLFDEEFGFGMET